MFKVKLIILFFNVYFLSTCFSLPPHKRLSDEEYDKIVQDEAKTQDDKNILEELGIEYTRYLQQVIETLEKDEQFKEKLQSANESDIKTAKIADELEYVSHHVRSKLDELKRTELQRLRELARQAYHPSQGHDFQPPGHVDHENPNTFEIKDLKKLIHKVAQDLEEADKKRKKMFKEYEMEKHIEQEEKLKNMTENERKQFISEEEQKKRMEAEAKKRVHHPGSKQQLEEVWEEQDHMNKNDFDPKTFFVMHDIDGNGFLDEDEVKTLFLKELDKLYAQGMPHADLMERAEEMERMREHVFKEVDKNHDRLISWEEFHLMSMRPEFTDDTGWDPIDQQHEYTQEELHAYERQRAEMEQHLRQNQIPDYGYPAPGSHQTADHGGYNNYPQHPVPGQQPQYAYQQPGNPQMHQQYPGQNQVYQGQNQVPNQVYQGQVPVPNQAYHGQNQIPNQGYQGQVPVPNQVYQGQNQIPNQVYQNQVPNSGYQNLPPPAPNQGYSNQANQGQNYQGNQVNQAPNTGYQQANVVPNQAYQGQPAQPAQPPQPQVQPVPQQSGQQGQQSNQNTNQLPNVANPQPSQTANDIHASKQPFGEHPNNLPQQNSLPKV